MTPAKTTGLITLGTAATLILAVADPVTAQSLPTRRAGLWKSETFSTDKKPAAKDEVMRAQMCVDAATDRKLMEHSLTKGASDCSPHTVKREGAAHVVSLSCKNDKGTVDFKTVYTGDFNSRIQAVTTSKQTPQEAGSKDEALRQVSTLVSPQCPEGWKPGDVQVEGLPKFNVFGALNFAEGLMKDIDKLFGK
jgi:hypothetical protein